MLVQCNIVIYIVLMHWHDLEFVEKECIPIKKNIHFKYRFKNTKLYSTLLLNLG